VEGPRWRPRLGGAARRSAALMPPKQATSIDFSHLGDKKLEKGKKATLDQAETWKGPNHKERLAEKLESKKKIQKAQYAKAEKASWKKQVGGAVAIVFMCGAGLFQFVMTIMDFIAGTGITDLDARDTATLKQVLFGGEPWLVYCVNNETVNQRLPKVLEDSAKTLSGSLGLKTGVLKCWDPTESGRSIAQRFKLKLSPPLTFVVANANKPRVVNMVGVSKAEDLEKKLKPALKVDVSKISTLKSWSSQCTSRRACVVVGHKWPAQKDAAVTLLRPLLERHRSVKVVTLDTSFWQLKLDDPVMATRPAKEKGQKSADVLCLARREGNFSSNETHVGRFLDALDASSASSLLAACAKQEGLVPITVPPRIKTRPSKPAKVVTPEPWRPSASPTPKPPPPKKPARANVDAVGSRQRMEEEDEALFEAVEEDEGDEGDQGSEDGEEEAEADEGHEVEL